MELTQTMEYLDNSHPEWDPMWQTLASYPINNGDALCINAGQCWEYMGSSSDHHHFRHASHPTTHRAEYIYIERGRSLVGWS